MPKKTKRSTAKYPALDPSLNLKTRTNLIDYDYIDQLSDKEKEWLNTFTEEYTSANIGKKSKLHKTKELKKDCYDRNNSRNRDVLTRAEAQGKAFELEKIRKKFADQFTLEDLTAFIIDHNIRDEEHFEKVIKRKLKALNRKLKVEKLTE